MEKGHNQVEKTRRKSKFFEICFVLGIWLSNLENSLCNCTIKLKEIPLKKNLKLLLVILFFFTVLMLLLSYCSMWYICNGIHQRIIVLVSIRAMLFIMGKGYIGVRKMWLSKNNALLNLNQKYQYKFIMYFSFIKK